MGLVLSAAQFVPAQSLVFYVQGHKRAEYHVKIRDKHMGAATECLSPAGRKKSLRITSESLKRYLIQVTVCILPLFWEWCPSLSAFLAQSFPEFLALF